MAGIFFQPQQPDYRGLWDWNPVQTFITAKNELESADLKRAESDRLKAKTDLDMRVTEQMLPLEVNLAKAKIAKTIAEQGYLNSRANKDIENSTSELYYQGYQSGDLDKAFPTSTPSSSSRSGSSSVLGGGSVLTPSSGGAGGDFSSFSLPSPLTSFAPNDQPQVLDQIASEIPEDQVAAVRNPPLDRMTASLSGAGAPVDLPRTPKVTNKSDWDNDPRTVADLETSNPLTSLQIPEEKRKELAALNDSSGALNPSKDEGSAAPKPQGVGELLVSKYGKVRRAEEIASKSKGDAKARMLGLAYGGRDDIGAEVASALNLADRSLGSNAAEILLKSPNGQIRDAGAINKIVALVDKGLGVGEAAGVYEATRKNELANMFKDPAKDEAGKDLSQLLDNQKKAQEALTLAEESKNPVSVARAKAAVDLYDGQLNTATNGQYFREQHNGIQRNISAAISNVNNPKVNWRGVDYDKTNKDDPMDSLSANDYLTQMAGDGQLPTITVKNGGADTSVADAYLKRFGVDSTTVGIWEGNVLKPFTYTPANGEKALKPIGGKATKAPLPETAGEQAINKAIQEIDAKESVSNSERRQLEIKKIDDEIARLSSTMSPGVNLNPMPGRFMPAGDSKASSTRPKNKAELLQSKAKIQKLKERRSLLAGE